MPALGGRASLVNNRNVRLSVRLGTNAVDMEPTLSGAGFSEASPGFGGVPATGQALVVADSHVSIPAKAAPATTAPMNFNKTAFNLRPN
jgi:hypothetical protein